MMLSGFIVKYLTMITIFGNDYNSYVVIVASFEMFIVIASLQTANLLTRELRIDSINRSEINQQYALSYWLTSTIAAFFYFFFLIFYDLIDIDLILFLPIALMFRTFSEFYIANLRASSPKDQKWAAIISIFPQIFRLISYSCTFFINKSIISTKLLLFFYGSSQIFYFLNIQFLVPSLWRTIKFRIFRLELKSKLKKSFRIIKQSILLSFNGFFRKLVNFLVIFIASLIIKEEQFKQFDFALYFISIFSIVGSNILIANVTKADNFSFNKKVINKFILIVLWFLVPTLIIFSIILINSNILILIMTFLKLPGNYLKKLVIPMAFLPIPLLIGSYLRGKMNALGKYHEITVYTLISFSITLINIIISYFTSSIFLLMLSYTIQNLIELLLFYHNICT